MDVYDHRQGRGQITMTPKDLRNALGLTQQQFATKLGISISTVTRWESGRSKKISPMAREKLNQLESELGQR